MVNKSRYRPFVAMKSPHGATTTFTIVFQIVYAGNTPVTAIRKFRST